MSIKIEPPKITELKPQITVIGVGGAGGNALGNMISSGLEGVDFIAANTDAQALAMSTAERRIQLGANLTHGLGAGAQPEIGQAAAEEAADEIRAQLDGSHMAFLAAGMGGGTGTGALPVVARIAREMGILTVGIVTKPFHFEGVRRMRIAEAGIAELKPIADTLIVIPNQNLFRIADEKTTFAEAFVLADQVLYAGIACIIDLIVKDGLINLDFADVKAVMQGMGSAMMGTGEASGEDRAIHAAEQALMNPLLDDVSLSGARGLLVSIVGGRDMTLFDVDAAASRVKEEIRPDANIIVGAGFDEQLDGRIRVALVASGMDLDDVGQPGGARQPGSHHAIPAIGNPPRLHPDAPGHGARAFGADAHEPARDHDAAGGPHDPYLGGAEPSEFARLLEDAVGSADTGDAADSERQHAHRHPGATQDPGWHTSDGVMIEEMPSGAGSRQTPPPLPSRSTAHPDEMPPSGSFQPQPPATGEWDVPRIPDVADFPIVGQREYYAHQNPDASSAERAPSGAAGLFRRLGITNWSEPRDDAERDALKKTKSERDPQMKDGEKRELRRRSS